MASEQLETIIGALRSRPRATDASIADQRAGFDQIASMFPLAEDVRCEPVEVGDVAAEWIAAIGREGV